MRRGVLKPESTAVFVPVQVVSELPPCERRKEAEPVPIARADPAVADGKIEITLADGTSIRVGHDISLATLRRVVTVLRG